MPDTPNTPVVEYPHQSVVLDTVLIERVSSQLGNYAPLEPGGPFEKKTHNAAQVTRFDGHEFLGQKATEDPAWIQRYYGKVPSTQDVANWERGYSGESNTHPIFQRRYLEKRDSYAPRTKLSVLPGLYRIPVTAAGADYTSAPTVVFTGGTGSGATAIAVLNNSGGVAKIVIKAEGTYTVAPTVSFTGGGGTGATATAEVQPSGALLVQEKTTDDAPEPYRSLYIVAWRIYETLPGPWLPYSRDDDNLGRVDGMRRAVIYTGQLPSRTDTTYTRYEARDGSSIVAWEIVEKYGAGIPAGSFPELDGQSLTEAVRGEIVSTESQVVAAGTAPDTGSKVISSMVEAINTALSIKKTTFLQELPGDETWYEDRAISLPLLIFDITHTAYCNDTSFARLVTTWSTDGGTTNVRKHRITVSYHETAPTALPMGVNVIEKTNIQFNGVFINFSKGDVLIDALAFEGIFALSDEMDACGWTEEYDYAATSPSATDFAAGEWYLAPNGYQVQPFGQSMFRSTLIEFYSAAGEPPP